MIKQIFKTIIVSVLWWEARLILKKYQPKIIGVTGSVGKTSTKEMIATVLRGEISCRKSEKSYNSELGVPLTIIGRRNAWLNPLGWLANILAGFYLIVFKYNYPDWLILEVGADRPGDIRKISKWLKPDIAVLTSLPEIPVHVEFFPTKEALLSEKKHLLKAVKKHGCVVLNIDDENIKNYWQELKKEAEERRLEIITIGFDEEADLRATNSHISYDPEKKIPTGITCKLDHNGNNVPVKINGAVGQHQIYQALSAIAVGAFAKLNTINMLEALSAYQPPPGRLRLLAGIKETLILDDTYNSSPVAVEAALFALKDIVVSGRKIAVLGDMMELGQYTIDAHKSVGELAAQVCDLLLTIGLRAKFIAEGAQGKKFNAKKMVHFDDALEAGRYLQEHIKVGDLILIKGSQYMRMEKTVEEIMLHPEDKIKLLVRQDDGWEKR